MAKPVLLILWHVNTVVYVRRFAPRKLSHVPLRLSLNRVSEILLKPTYYKEKTTVLNTTTPDVLVVGAGPAGLTAAAEAIRHGLTVRIIDQNESRTSFSKALVVHSRTLEIFQDMGFAANVINSGQEFHALNMHIGKKSLSRIVFQDLKLERC